MRMRISMHYCFLVSKVCIGNLVVEYDNFVFYLGFAKMIVKSCLLQRKERKM